MSDPSSNKAHLMKFLKLFLFNFFISGLVKQVSSSFLDGNEKTLLRGSQRRNLKKNKIVCRILLIGVQEILTNIIGEKSRHDHLRWVCEVDPLWNGETDQQSYIIDGIATTFPDKIDELANGLTYIEVPSSVLQEVRDGQNNITKIRLQSIDEVIILDGIGNDHQSRQLKRFNGNRDVLIIRVESKDSNTTMDAAYISNAFFGTDGKPVNPKRQMDLCSKNQTRFIPATGPESIKDGVMTVRLEETIVGKLHLDIKNKVIQKATSTLNKSLSSFKHVAICLPHGTISTESNEWVAFGYYAYYLSVYNDQWCSSLSATLHEIGHNLGLHHSGQSSPDFMENEYGDQSGIMGYSYSNTSTPQMCFNAAKSWWLGFYQDRTTTITHPTFIPQQLKLAGVVDYYNGLTFDYTVILRLQPAKNSLKDQNRFLMFNRAKGFNKGSLEFRNDVTIVRQAPVQLAKSNAEGKLEKVGDRHILHNWNAENNNLVIQLCGLQSGDVDFAIVQVYLSNIGGSYKPCINDNGYGYIGCYQDKPLRYLPHRITGTHTIESCESHCSAKKYLMFGLQYLGECRCGNYMINSVRVSEHECNTQCTENKDQICGGPWRNSVYKVRGYDECSGDLSLNPPGSNIEFNIDSCKAACTESKYKFYELKYLGQCSCWNDFPLQCQSSAIRSTPSLPPTPAPSSNTLNSPSPEQLNDYLGCYKDSPKRQLPHRIINNNHSKNSCRSSCAALNFTYFGLQWKGECRCGNSLGNTKVPENECNTICISDSSQKCGGAWRNSVFKIQF